MIEKSRMFLATSNKCFYLQHSAPPPVLPTADTWRPGAVTQASVRDQPRHDQTRTEEHPGAGDSDDDDEEQLDR